MSSIPDGTLDFTHYPCRTHSIKTGCGNLYVTVEYNHDNTVHRVRIWRNSKFNCSLVMREALAKQATYQIRRDPHQLIKDLKGSKAHACKEYNITAKAYSCSDAVSKIVEREIEKETKDKKEI